MATTRSCAEWPGKASSSQPVGQSWRSGGRRRPLSSGRPAAAAKKPETTTTTARAALPAPSRAPAKLRVAFSCWRPNWLPVAVGRGGRSNGCYRRRLLHCCGRRSVCSVALSLSLSLAPLLWPRRSNERARTLELSSCYVGHFVSARRRSWRRTESAGLPPPARREKRALLITGAGRTRSALPLLVLQPAAWGVGARALALFDPLHRRHASSASSTAAAASSVHTACLCRSFRSAARQPATPVAGLQVMPAGQPNWPRHRPDGQVNRRPAGAAPVRGRKSPLAVRGGHSRAKGMSERARSLGGGTPHCAAPASPLTISAVARRRRRQSERFAPAPVPTTIGRARLRARGAAKRVRALSRCRRRRCCRRCCSACGGNERARGFREKRASCLRPFVYLCLVCEAEAVVVLSNSTLG